MDADTATMVIKSPKAATPAECKTLEQLPNIGPSLAKTIAALAEGLPVPMGSRAG